MRSLIKIATACCILAAASPAAVITYKTNLSGPNESPVNDSPGTGTATVSVDTTALTLFVTVTFSGLTSGTTASHIHCCTTIPGTGTAAVATAVPTFPGFPLGVQSGTYTQTFDMTNAATWNPAFITSSGGTVAGAEAAFIAGYTSGSTYLNIHTTNFPGGEIRGFLAPEPATMALMGGALLALAGLRRRRRA